MKYFVSAGEASGDIHAAGLIAALRQGDPEAEIMFLGGDLMAAEAGCQPLIHYRDMAFMGFSEVIRHLGKVLGNLSTARDKMLSWRPDALILVDYPSFNLKLAKAAHKAGIPVFYYISPKVWAWKEHRVKQMRRYVKRILSILPFEVDYFRDRHGMEIDYVGNPSVKEVDAKLAALSSDADFRRRHSLPADRPLLAIVAGSRQGEIRNNLPVMAEVARRHPDLYPVIAGAPGIDPHFYSRYADFTVVDNDTFQLMAHSVAALVTSGTATLEAALIGVPQVVCYRSNGSRLAYNIFKRILKIPFVSLPNLIAGSEIVAEQLLHLCTPDLVDRRLSDILPCAPGRAAMLDAYAGVRSRLTTSDAPTRAASLILSDLRTKISEESRN